MTDAYGHYDAADLGLPSAASNATINIRTEIDRLLRATGYEIDYDNPADLSSAVDAVIKADEAWRRLHVATVHRAQRAEWALRQAGMRVPIASDGQWEPCSADLRAAYPTACRHLPTRDGVDGHEHWLPAA